MFRFTIRDVLWLMVVAGLACGWWLERQAAQSYKRNAANWESKAIILRDVVEKTGPLIVKFQEDSVHLDARPTISP